MKFKLIRFSKTYMYTYLFWSMLSFATLSAHDQIINSDCSVSRSKRFSLYSTLLRGFSLGVIYDKFTPIVEFVMMTAANYAFFTFFIVSCGCSLL